MTTQNVGSPRNFTSTVVANTAIVCFSYSVLVLLLLHLLRRDYSVRSHMISDYGVGPYGWVMSSCFIAMSCGLLMLLLGVFRSGPRSAVARIGTLLLGIAAVGLVISAIFPTDLPGMPSTRSGEIHDISFFANVGSIILATLLLSFSFGSDSRWRAYRPTALSLVSLILIAVVLQFLTLHRGMPYGYTNRLFVVVLFGWLLGTAIRLRAVARDSAREA
jgi:hypothetical membrane protein